jgi:transposase
VQCGLDRMLTDGHPFTVEQQATLALHRVRQSFVKARTAQANQIRGLLSEFGLVVPRGIKFVLDRVPSMLEDASNSLPVISEP